VVHPWRLHARLHPVHLHPEGRAAAAEEAAAAAAAVGNQADNIKVSYGLYGRPS